MENSRVVSYSVIHLEPVCVPTLLEVITGRDLCLVFHAYPTFQDLIYPQHIPMYSRHTAHLSHEESCTEARRRDLRCNG